MQKQKTAVIAGCIILAAAILAVAFAAVAPRISAKREMKRQFAAAACDTAQYIAFVDPLYADPKAPFGGGRTVALQGEDLAAVREALSALSARFSYRKSKREESSALDRHLLVLTADGEYVQIFFNDESFYYLKEGRIYLFKPKDAAAFAALLALLNGVIQ